MDTTTDKFARLLISFAESGANLPGFKCTPNERTYDSLVRIGFDKELFL